VPESDSLSAAPMLLPQPEPSPEPPPDTPADTQSSRLRCPECGQMYTGAHGLGVHRSVKHGVTGKSSTKPASGNHPCGIEDCRFVSKTSQGVGMHRWHVHGIPGKSKTISRTNVATLVKGDDIVNIVLSQLFPGGVPVDKIRAVLVWSQHTDAFIEQVRA
jgi:hypothetical protein